MRVLVCGGRYYKDKVSLFEYLDEEHKRQPIDLLIEGGAGGADRLAKAWAVANEVPAWTFKANWDLYGNAAGPIRNTQMLEDGKPHKVIAFPGGSGTMDMMKKATKAGVPVVNVREILNADS